MKFSEDVIRHSQIQSRIAETALVCAVDLCRVASRVHPDGDVPVRLLAYDIAPEIKVRLVALVSSTLLSPIFRVPSGIPSPPARSRSGTSRRST